MARCWREGATWRWEDEENDGVRFHHTWQEGQKVDMALLELEGQPNHWLRGLSYFQLAGVVWCCR